MNLVQSLLVNNPCYKANKKIEVKGLMLHSVGCAQPNAQVFVNNWNKESYGRACVHGFIDGNDGTIYQTLPWNHRGWHGGGSSNNTHIGVEMCEPGCIKYPASGVKFEILDEAKALESVRKTYNSAVELFAMLCKQFDLDPLKSGVIVSHKEGSVLGISSNHGDPEHLWNRLNTGYTMDGFRKDVAAKMGNAVVIQTIQPSSEFKVKCLDNLNVRKSPNMGDNIVTPDGCKQGGVYTIIETNGDWGLLKSFSAKKDGWICISSKYVKRV